MADPVPFFDLTDEERQAVFEQSARQLGWSARILEKDLWVCWTLRQLFALPAGSPSLTFKGGTSLSKVFGAIRRFSEDVDITVDYRSFGISPDPADPSVSQTQAERIFDQFGERVREFAENLLVPVLSERLQEVSPGTRNDVTLLDDGQTIELAFPKVTDTSASSLKDVVRIELGARNTTEPNEPHQVSAEVQGTFPNIAFPAARVVVLSPVRTFWEKATILHAEYHRQKPLRGADRMARHWYDLATLADHMIGEAALKKTDMLIAVANHKKRFFRAGWASYDTARPGTLRLVPEKDLEAALRADFNEMVQGGMFFETPPSFDAILERLTRLERQINRGKGKDEG